jgi:hypothetical protein
LSEPLALFERRLHPEVVRAPERVLRMRGCLLLRVPRATLSDGQSGRA